MSEIYEYSGYLTFSPLAAEKLQKARSFIDQSGLGIDVGETVLEFEYAGRDTHRKMIALLRNLASLIGKADGEIICEIANEDGDPMFEFYTIKNRELYVQKGRIVREKSKQKVGQGV